MDNDAKRHEVGEALAIVREQVREMAKIEQELFALAASATEADGAVEVSIDAQRMVSKIVIDESFLDDFEFSELGGFLTRAAQAAHQKLEQHTGSLAASMDARRKALASIYDSVVDDSDHDELLSSVRSPERGLHATRSANGNEGDDGPVRFPVVRG